MDNSQQYFERVARSLLDEMESIRPLWTWLAKRIMPSLLDAIKECEPNVKPRRDIVDVAAESMHGLAAAHYSYITPAGQAWFAFRGEEQEDIYKRWFSKASETSLGGLGRSNFYSEMHEGYLSRVAFGTALVLTEPKPDGSGVIFRSIPIASYGMAEDADGVINTVARRFEYSAAQAVARFGYKALPDSVTRAYDRADSRYIDKFKFIHLVMPRDSYTNGNGVAKSDATQMAFISAYLYEGDSCVIVEEGGYEEFPYMATRFEKWPGTVWGFPPALKCMSSLSSVSKMENNMDILSDLAAFPRIMKLAEQVGEIDFRAGGQTVISPQAAQMGLPREWGTSGRYDVGKDRIAEKEQKIRAAFFVPFLQPITQRSVQMTATEVRALQDEQAFSFSPTFAMFSNDISVLLYRVFSILYRQGAFNSVKATQPPSLKVRDNDGTDHFKLAMPKVHLLGRIAQTLEQSQKAGLEYFFQMLGGYIQMTGDQSALDYLDSGKAIKMLYLSTGAPDDILLTDADVQQLRAERAANEQAMAQAQAANQAAAAQQHMAQAQAVTNSNQAPAR